MTNLLLIIVVTITTMTMIFCTGLHDTLPGTSRVEAVWLDYPNINDAVDDNDDDDDILYRPAGHSVWNKQS